MFMLLPYPGVRISALSSMLKEELLASLDNQETGFMYLIGMLGFLFCY